MAEKTPYDLIEEAYQAALGQTGERRTAAQTNKSRDESKIRDMLRERNRGAGIQYNQLINPFGANAEQRGVMGTGTSDYIRNAAYGQLLQGRAQNQRTYQDSFDSIQDNFNNYLLELAGLETEALNTRNSAIDERQRYDKEQERLAREEEERKRQFEEQQRLERDRLAEQQRQFNAQMSAAATAAAAAASGGSGTGGTNLGNTNPTVNSTPNRYAPIKTAPGAYVGVNARARDAARRPSSNSRPRTYTDPSAYKERTNPYVPRYSVR